MKKISTVYKVTNTVTNDFYIGCILSDVKDRLQDMIEMKGRDYAIDYMTTHWPKIDLQKIL